MGSPAGSSGTGTGSRANVYTPTAQPAADQNFQTLVSQLIGASGPNSPGGWAYPQAQSLYGNYFGGASPAAGAYPQALDIYSSFLNPYQPTAQNTGAVLGNVTNDWLQNLLQPGIDSSRQLFSSGNQILDTAFDPRSDVYNQNRDKVMEGANVSNAMAGVGNTPYGASMTSDALQGFQTDWANKQLARQESGLNAAGTAFGRGGALGAQTANEGIQITPAQQNFYTGEANNAISGLGNVANLGRTIPSDALNALSQVTNLGNNQFQLTQQALNDLQSYLGLGQAASGLSGQLGQMGFNQLASGIGGGIQGLAGLNSLAGTGGISGLLGGAGGAGASGVFDSAGSLLGSGLGGIDTGILDAAAGAGGVGGGGGSLLSMLPFAAS